VRLSLSLSRVLTTSCDLDGMKEWTWSEDLQAQSLPIRKRAEILSLALLPHAHEHFCRDSEKYLGRNPQPLKFLNEGYSTANHQIYEISATSANYNTNKIRADSLDEF
jgi:hypothetical protein